MDKTTVTYLELVNEMLERGLSFDKMDLYKSDPIKFLVTENGLRPPGCLGGVGENAAKSIAAARDINRPFISQEDLRQRSGVNKSVIEKLADMGVLGDLPENNQIDLFA